MATTFSHRLTCLVLLLYLCLFGCSQQGQEDKKVLATINDYHMTLDEFQFQLSEELELEKEFKVTLEAKKAFLEDLIRKELLIQEAKRLKLDTKEQFIRTIQRYWESTLIRNVLDLKSRDIVKKIIVSEEDVVARYNEMARVDASIGPLEQMRGAVIEELKEEQKTAMLETWLQDLRQKATVHFKEELL